MGRKLRKLSQKLELKKDHAKKILQRFSIYSSNKRLLRKIHFFSRFISHHLFYLYPFTFFYIIIT